MDVIKKLPERVLYLDFIRFFATLMIILFHFNVELTNTYPQAFIFGNANIFHQTLGIIGVSLFIILSGASLMISAEKNYSLPSFFKKRIISIYPAFWICYLLILLARIVIKHSLPGDDQYWKFIYSFLALDGFLSYQMKNFYLIGEWFTGFILITYLFFPLLRMGLLKSPKLSWLLLLLTVFVTCVFYNDIFTIQESFNPLMRLPEFFFGMCFAKYFTGKDKPSLYAFIISFVVVVLFYFWKPAILDLLYTFILNAMLFMIMAFVLQQITVGKILSSSLSFLSKHSFVAFLLHHQIIIFLSPRINPIELNHSEIYGYFIFVVFLSFAGAVCLEKPIQLLSNYMKRYI